MNTHFMRLFWYSLTLSMNTYLILHEFLKGK